MIFNRSSFAVATVLAPAALVLIRSADPRTVAVSGAKLLAGVALKVTEPPFGKMLIAGALSVRMDSCLRLQRGKDRVVKVAAVTLMTLPTSGHYRARWALGIGFANKCRSTIYVSPFWTGVLGEQSRKIETAHEMHTRQLARFIMVTYS